MTRRKKKRTGRPIRDFGRAAGGALVFSLPMLMTMEMWWLGFYLEPWRLLVLIVTAIPLLIVLSRQVGFEETRRWRDDLLDTAIAIGVAALVCTLLLFLFGTIESGMPLREVAGKIVVQIVPASIGALLATSQFAAGDGEEEPPAEKDETYGGEIFLMGVGALFLGFNVAPTEEMLLISFRMTEWHALGLVLLSIALMHGFVFAVGFAGGSDISPEEPWWSPLVRLTLPGYVVALAVSVYLLWIFGRFDELSAGSIVMATVVLTFPSAIGAAAARLIL